MITIREVLREAASAIGAIYEPCDPAKKNFGPNYRQPMPPEAFV